MPVVEMLLVVGAVVLLSGGLLLLPLVPPETLLLVGAGLVAIGLASGVPAGLWYHVALHRCLAPRGELPPRWWVHPVSLHGRLAPAERARVLPWFVAGGVGFGVIVVGCLVVVGGVAAQLVAARALAS